MHAKAFSRITHLLQLCILNSNLVTIFGIAASRFSRLKGSIDSNVILMGENSFNNSGRFIIRKTCLR